MRIDRRRGPTEAVKRTPPVHTQSVGTPLRGVREHFIAPSSPSRSALRFCLHAPAHLLLLLIRLYQRTLSPALPVFFGPACGCRFTPTCSHYAAEAIQTRGFLVGTALALWRLVKCTPLHPGGFDPVPARRKPVCHRAPTLA